MTSAPATLSRPRSARAGFTLVELMITLVLLAVVVAVLATVLIGSQRSKADTEGRLEAQQSGRSISDAIAQDIRTAGYGVDTDASPAQTPIAYCDSVEIMINANLTPFPDTLTTGPQDPKALNPAFSPLPHKLTGSYLPAGTFATGAETILYTLDLNQDGVIDASDQSAALAIEAQRTPNPNDYVIGRAVYGANSGSNNGGSMQKVGLVRGPGAGIPYLFTVFLNSSTTPWDWHLGPIPANRLKDITSIKLQVTTEGRRARQDGTYPRATLTTEINSLRNTPNAAQTQTLYHVTGYVFTDTNKNHLKDVGETGIANVLMRLGGTSVAVTSSVGFYDVSAPPGAYILKQSVPASYGAFGPDSLVVDWNASPGDVAYNFSDTTLTGAWVNDTCYVDANGNGICDAADTNRVAGATLTAGGQSTMSGGDGGSHLFVPAGTQTYTVSPPDSFAVIGTNPVTITVVNGVTQTLYTKMSQSGTGTVTGYVYKDTNKNGTKDAGEAGISGVWAGVTSNGGANVLGYATTDVNGLYTIQVANNMPAATTPYSVTFVPPDNYYPTSATAITPIWVTTGQTVSGNNFGVVNFVAIGLLADRVLALGTADLLPFDWNGNAGQWASKGSFAEDLILCSEYVSNPNISVWLNKMPNTPVFDSVYTYQRNAQSSALSIATGSIDTSAAGVNVVAREDAVTGLGYKASGNIAVWLTQNTSNNEGQFVNSPQLYMSNDNGDVNQVLLQDCAGSNAIDMIVGTKSPTAYTGTIEVWRGSGLGTFVRDEIYPPNGAIPGGALGEVRAMTLADVTGDGNKDLIVGTRTGDGTGKVHILRYVSKVTGARYVTVNTYNITGEVNAIGMTDVDGDGKLDLIVGTRISSSAGDIQYWKGNGSGSFTYTATFTAPGPVLCITIADMGGTGKQDIVYGFRNNESSFAGGVRILYLDLNALPPDDVDPAGGTSSYMTTSIAAWNFNYRLNSTTAGPYYMDLAVAQKLTATTGRLLVYVR